MGAMKSAEFIIVGGGVSGLYAARLLTELGRDWCLLEGRPFLGGRILSVAVPGTADLTHSTQKQRFDLGPSWYWPEYQGELAQLIEQLGLKVIPQYESGDLMYERVATEAPIRMPAYISQPQSWRLVGGMAALVEGLQRDLDAQRLYMGQAVRALRLVQGQVEVTAMNETGELKRWLGKKILLALPPRLVIERLGFNPALPESLTREWSATPTWMAPHAKYLAIYEDPFWRDQGLSGEARSALGPLNEIHDASLPGGAALFGFLGMPSRIRRTIPEERLKSECLNQLSRIFGVHAAAPIAEFYKDWAIDPFTATAADVNIAMDHISAPDAAPSDGPWAGWIRAIGSEWATGFPGYIAGAMEGAKLGVEAFSCNVNA